MLLISYVSTFYINIKRTACGIVRVIPCHIRNGCCVPKMMSRWFSAYKPCTKIKNNHVFFHFKSKCKCILLGVKDGLHIKHRKLRWLALTWNSFLNLLKFLAYDFYPLCKQYNSQIRYKKWAIMGLNMILVKNNQ